MLFGQRPDAPQWRDLAEATRVEAVSILAQLLRSVHAGKQSHAPQRRGDRDE